jgi:hypothetical protein
MYASTSSTDGKDLAEVKGSQAVSPHPSANLPVQLAPVHAPLDDRHHSPSVSAASDEAARQVLVQSGIHDSIRAFGASTSECSCSS